MPNFSPVLVAPILGFAGSILGVVIAPLFTWRISRGQRLLERKLVVYEQLLGDIHQIRYAADNRLDQMKKGETGLTSDKMREEFNDARERMMKLADSNAYLFPDEFLEAVREINTMIYAGDKSVAERYFANAVTATDKGREAVVKVARADLGVHQSRKLVDRFKLLWS